MNYLLEKKLMDQMSKNCSGSIGNSQSQASGSSSSSSSSPSSTTQLGDSCGNKLNVNVVFPFDTISLNCFPVWNAQDFILRVSTIQSQLLHLWHSDIQKCLAKKKDIQKCIFHSCLAIRNSTSTEVFVNMKN